LYKSEILSLFTRSIFYFSTFEDDQIQMNGEGSFQTLKRKYKVSCMTHTLCLYALALSEKQPKYKFIDNILLHLVNELNLKN